MLQHKCSGLKLGRGRDIATRSVAAPPAVNRVTGEARSHTTDVVIIGTLVVQARVCGTKY